MSKHNHRQIKKSIYKMRGGNKHKKKPEDLGMDKLEGVSLVPTGMTADWVKPETKVSLYTYTAGSLECDSVSR